MGNDTGFPKHNWAHTPGVPESNTLCLHCGTGPDSDIHLRTTEGSAKPPAGYMECPKKCGRWTINTLDPSQPPSQCWECAGVPALYQKIHPDWTPPVAAPAHVERRKGQRWKCQVITGPALGLEELFTPAEYDVANGGWATAEGSFKANERWTYNGYRMTLLTDAPADPSGAGDDSCHDCFSLRKSCTIHVQFKAPPAQGVPKTAPACVGASKVTHSGAVLTRVLRHSERIVLCDGCYLADEVHMTGIGQPGPLRNPGVTERLPRPALARDELVEGDCWPESDR